MKRMKIGDVFKITTPKGDGYLHCIFKNKAVGELVRVLPGLYTHYPTNIKTLICSQEKYMMFFPLSVAAKQNIVEWTCFYPAIGFEKPSYMRTEHIVGKDFLGWHIVNTETWQSQFGKNLTTEQKRLSAWGIWNDTLLIEKLADDWIWRNGNETRIIRNLCYIFCNDRHSK